MTTLGSEGTGVNDHFWCSARTQFSGALLRGDGGKRGPALLDVLAAAVRALHLVFFVIHERQNLVEEFIAVRAEEFVLRASNNPPLAPKHNKVVTDRSQASTDA